MASCHKLAILAFMPLMSLVSAVCSDASPELCTEDSAEALHMLQVKKSDRGSAGLKRYSQFGQDQWLNETYGAGYKGFYLDIGAHNGEVLSNTQALDERGWKGICVEPLPVNFEKRTCRIYKQVLSDTTGEDITFEDCVVNGTDHGDGGLSGIAGIGLFANSEKRQNCSKAKFQTMRFDDFLKTVENMPVVIDYMSIDVEGSEGKILSHFPWESHCLKTLTIERPSPEVVNMLFDHGCKLSAYLGEDHAYKCSCFNR